MMSRINDDQKDDFHTSTSCLTWFLRSGNDVTIDLAIVTRARETSVI